MSVIGASAVCASHTGFLTVILILILIGEKPPPIKITIKIKIKKPVAPRRGNTMKPLLILCVLIAGASAAPAAEKPMELHVATHGNDAWTGRLARPNRAGTDGPVASLQRARDLARLAPAGTPRRITVHAGDYFLEQPLLLEAPDSGLTLQAAPREKVTLYGGRRVTGWMKEGDRFWAAPLPEVADRKWDFRMLVVNGRFCRRARLPAEGFFEHLSEFKVPGVSTTGGGWQRQPTPEELTTLRFREGDLGPWLDLANAELTVYHMWDESVVGVKALDLAAHTVTFSNPAGHPPGGFGVKKYTVWNTREGMTQPGQWFLDRTAGKVVYWPLPGEAMEGAAVVAPTVESIVRIQGNKDAPVRDVTVSGLRLSVAGTPLQAGGFGAGSFAGAVNLAFAQGCRLSDLEVTNVGGQGIKGRNCTGARIERCEVHETGACGIFVQGDGNVISDNRVHHVGVTYPSAIALWIGGDGTEVSHNEVHHAPYTGIAAGGKNHRIEANLIYEAMRELHDGAAIYITFCKAITVRGNVVRDITDTGGYGASAYYLDEQAEDCLVEGNLSVRVARPSHNHMAKNNIVRGNVFLTDGDATLTFPKSAGYVLERNVICAGGKVAFTNPPAVATCAGNLIRSGKSQYDGVPADVSHADPLFVAPDKNDFRFRADSPAPALGIAPLDLKGVGPRGRRAD